VVTRYLAVMGPVWQTSAGHIHRKRDLHSVSTRKEQAAGADAEGKEKRRCGSGVYTSQFAESTDGPSDRAFVKTPSTIAPPGGAQDIVNTYARRSRDPAAQVPGTSL